MIYQLPVTWEVFGRVDVEAESLEEAIRKFDPDAQDLPTGTYVDGSFRLTSTDPGEVQEMISPGITQSHPRTLADRRADHQLATAKRLMDEDKWADYDVWPRAEWERETSEGNTQRGYWDWVFAKIEEAQEDEPLEIPLSEAMSKFFNVEIRNEAQGGISPSTLGSAHDSIEQAPHDVLASWTGLSEQQITFGNFHSEFAELMLEFGEKVTLAELLAHNIGQE